MEDPYARTQGEWERAASGHFKQEQVGLIQFSKLLAPARCAGNGDSI